MVNKDTQIFASFSTNPGNNGCLFFNKKFEENKINAIYKSFYSDNLCESIRAVKTLDIKGFAVSMPYKIEILKYVDEIDHHVAEIGAANTVLNYKGYLKAYNTDWLGVKNFINWDLKHLTILGDGGFSKAVQYYCKTSDIEYSLITRKNWDQIVHTKGFIFNATPVDIVNSDDLIDGRPHTETGKKIAELQAYEQYKLYIRG